MICSMALVGARLPLPVMLMIVTIARRPNKNFMAISAKSIIFIDISVEKVSQTKHAFSTFSPCETIVFPIFLCATTSRCAKPL